MADDIDLELHVQRGSAGAYTIALRISDAEARVEDSPVVSPSVTLDLAQLRELELDLPAYGRALGEMLLAGPELRSGLARAQAIAAQQGATLRLRLIIASGAGELHALRWEALADPESGRPLLLSNRVTFTRYVQADDLRPLRLRPRGALRALVVVASPRGLESFALAPIDALVEERIDVAALGAISAVTLDSAEHATLAAIVDRLRAGVDIFSLHAHCTVADGQIWLWLEDEQGAVDRVAGSDFVARVGELDTPPRLVLLASAAGGSGDPGAMAALGLRLVEAGVPAVVAMQRPLDPKSRERFGAALFAELQRDGRVDRAVSTARQAIGELEDWWAPALLSRLRAGKIWYEPGFGDERESFRKYPALLKAISDGRCTPIIGPGLLDPYVGSQRDLARRLAEKYNFPLGPGQRDDLAQVLQFLGVELSPGYIHDALAEAAGEELVRRFGAPPATKGARSGGPELLREIGRRRRAEDPGEPHRVLAALPLPIYLTANADSLLEDALREAGKEPTALLCPWNDDVAAKDALWKLDREPTAEAPLVYYLFGKSDERDSQVLTDDDYSSYGIGLTRNREMIPIIIRDVLSDSALLWLGFETEAMSFKTLSRTLLSMDVSRRRRRFSHIIQLSPLDEGRALQPERARRYLESYLGQSDLTIYWGTARDFTDDLRRQRDREDPAPPPRPVTKQASQRERPRQAEGSSYRDDEVAIFAGGRGAAGGADDPPAHQGAATGATEGSQPADGAEASGAPPSRAVQQAAEGEAPERAAGESIYAQQAIEGEAPERTAGEPSYSQQAAEGEAPERAAGEPIDAQQVTEGEAPELVAGEPIDAQQVTEGETPERTAGEPSNAEQVAEGKAPELVAGEPIYAQQASEGEAPERAAGEPIDAQHVPEMEAPEPAAQQLIDAQQAAAPPDLRQSAEPGQPDLGEFTAELQERGTLASDRSPAKSDEPESEQPEPATVAEAAEQPPAAAAAVEARPEDGAANAPGAPERVAGAPPAPAEPQPAGPPAPPAAAGAAAPPPLAVLIEDARARYTPPPAESTLCVEVFDDHARFRFGGKDYASPHTLVDEAASLTDSLRLDPQRHGELLFGAVFRDAEWDGAPSTRVGYEAARAASGGELRLELNLRHAPFEPLRWEYLRDPNRPGEAPLATSARSPLYRRPPVRVAGPAGPVAAQTLKICAALCSPPGLGDPQHARLGALEPLDVARQAEIIGDALAPLASAGAAAPTILGGLGQPPATLEAIAAALDAGCHVLHLLAHGVDVDGEYHLVIDHAIEGGVRPFVPAETFCDVLRNHGGELRLVVLASCRSAAASERPGPGDSLGATLVARGVAAVVGMQDLVAVNTVQFFTQQLYDDLARSGRVDMAVAATRYDLYEWLRGTSSTDWGIPVLYMGGGDGQLFAIDLARSAEQIPPHDPVIRSFAEPARDGAAVAREVARVVEAHASGAPGPGLIEALRAAVMPATAPEQALLAQGQRREQLAALRRPMRIDAADLRRYVEGQADGLVLDPAVYTQVAGALSIGKHVILTGPPGTGKTSVAHHICRYAAEQGYTAEAITTTASADWSTFDTVGGYVPTQQGPLQFRPGIFLRAISEGRWLVIDEINRAEIDKAFGELFTVLSGQPVDLPYWVGGSQVRITPGLRERDPRRPWVPATVSSPHEHIVHPNWRVIGAMNVYDRSSLFAMSFAFMRRFAFVELDVPPVERYRAGLIARWAGGGELTEDEQAALPELVCALLEAPALMGRRALGPAIVKDLVQHIAHGAAARQLPLLDTLAEAFSLYALPQLDALDQGSIAAIYAELGGIFGGALAREALLARIRGLYPHIRGDEWPA